MADRLVICFKRYGGNQRTKLLDVPSHTMNQNRRLWDSYDWSKGGEEWTNEAKKYRDLDPAVWKTSIINEMIMKYIKTDSTILEVGPGAGRWTEILQKLAKRLILADISQKCLSLCKEHFKACENMEYNLIESRLNFLANDSVDYIWSYDVFVHINPTDIRDYIIDFQRILKPGGYAIIHHADKYSNERRARGVGFRSYMNAKLFAQIVTEYQMEIVEQNSSLAHIPGDVITVFKKPG